MSLIQTASTVYIVDRNGEISEPIQGRAKVVKKESKFFAKLKQEITPEDIEREKDYQKTYKNF